MSTILEHSITAPRRGRPPIYPWNEWTDGRARRLWQGVDYQLDTPTMASTIRAHASRTGRGVVVCQHRDGNGLDFQFRGTA